MDGSRFDRLARGVALAPSRRALLRAALGGVLGGLFAGVGAEAVAAARPRTPGQICRKDADCASKTCGPKDSRGRRRCLCTATEQCPPPRRSQPCHEPVCSAEGVCELAVTVGKSCDDQNLCTESSTCQADGQCTGVPKDCHAEPCAVLACDDPEGPCYDTGTQCDPADVCTVGACDPATGACIRVPKVCDGPEDPVCGVPTCNALTGLCWYQPQALCPANDNPCNQVFCKPGLTPDQGACRTVSVECRTDDLCIQYHQCVPDGFDTGGNPKLRCVYTPMYCNDSNPCTVDSCVDGQCVYTPCEEDQCPSCNP